MKLHSSHIHIRPATESDKAFIFRTWIDSFRESPFGKQFPDDAYEQIQKEVITKLLAESETLIACVPDDHDSLIGFITFGKHHNLTLIHYAYVKFVYRRTGIGQLLVSHAKPTTPIICTHINRKFYELRSMNFLPIMTLREFDDLASNLHNAPMIDACNSWFISRLPEFRNHRAEILKERNKNRLFRKHHNKNTINEVNK